MALTAFYPPVVPHSTRFIRPVTRPAAVVRVSSKTQPVSSQRTKLVRGLLTRLCADPRTVYLRGQARPVNTVPREEWFWLSFDRVVRYQLHFPLPASVSSTVELYIEIAHLWPKIKAWNLGSATVDGLDTDITAILSEFAKGDVQVREEAAQKVAHSAIPSPTNMGATAYYALCEYSDRQSEHHQGLMELMENSL